MTDQSPGSPDEFDRFARAAGQALRRPAPADGAAGVRAVRRRQQVVRGVAGVGAVALIAGVGAVALSRIDRDERVATVPETTVPEPIPSTAPTTLPPTTVPGTTIPGTTIPGTTTPGTTTPGRTTPPTVAPGTSLVAWGNAQRGAGRTDVQRLPITGGDGALYLARRGSDDVAAAVMFSDGRVSEVPSNALPGPFGDLAPFDLGGRVAVVASSWGDDAPPRMSLLDPVTLVWSDGPDLGFAAADSTDQAWYVDGSILVGHGTWAEGDGNRVVGPDRSAVIVRPDLSVEQVATPPDGVQTSWTSVSGPIAFGFGYANVGSAFTYPPFPQAWSFDTRTNEWSAVPNPDWMTCPAAGCDWWTPTEGLPAWFEVGTDRGVVKLLLDGTVGVYDPDAGSWRRLDDPPFELTLPSTATIGELVVVAPASGGPGSPPAGSFTMLDVVGGTWLSGAVELAADDGGSWLLRSDDESVLLTRSSSSWPDASIDDAHDVVVDADTPTGRLVTNDEAGRWVPLSPWFDLTLGDLA